MHFYETCRRLKTVFDFIPKLYCATGFDIENEGNGFICMEYVDEAICTAVHDNLSKEQVIEVNTDSLLTIEGIYNISSNKNPP